MRKLKQGDIIQVTDPDHKLFNMLLIVDEVKTWGVQAYRVEPEINLYYIVKTGEFEKVGTAASRTWIERHK